MDDVGRHVAIGALAQTVLHQALGKVEDDRNCEHVVVLGERDERLAGVTLNVGRVDDRDAAQPQPRRRDSLEKAEGFLVDIERVLVIGYQCAARV